MIVVAVDADTDVDDIQLLLYSSRQQVFTITSVTWNRNKTSLNKVQDWGH